MLKTDFFSQFQIDQHFKTEKCWLSFFHQHFWLIKYLCKYVINEQVKLKI